jgi:hypothetical protein
MGTRATWLRAAGTGGGKVDLETVEDVAMLLGVPVQALASVQYGNGSVMWMVAETQLDKSIVPNHSACLVLQRFHGLPVWPRGDVVCLTSKPDEASP